VTTTELRRLSDHELQDIGRRLGMPINDEGLRNWYRADVQHLLAEVLVLRRERAATLEILLNNPPLDTDLLPRDTHGLSALAQRLADLWQEQLEGVWQRAEVKRIRELLATTKLNLAAMTQDRDAKAHTITELEQRLDQLEARNIDTIIDCQRAVESLRKDTGDVHQQVVLLLRQSEALLAE